MTTAPVITSQSGAMPVKILVVEDNPMDVRLIQYALAEQKDWTTLVRVAKDGEVAMSYFLAKGENHDWHPDLVILDLNLPKLPGIDVLRMIRSIDETRTLPVVILSSSPSDVIREAAKNSTLQPDLCLTKPIELNRFLELGAAFRQCFETVQERGQHQSD